MARRGRTHFGCSRPATAQPFPNRRDAENSPVATCLDPSSMALLVVAGRGGEQFRLDAGLAIGVINGDALRQLGSALHSRPMAGPRSVLKPSCADLFRASTPFLSGPSLPYAARPARGHRPALDFFSRHARTCSAHPRPSFRVLPFPTPPGRPTPTGPHSIFSFVMRGLVPRIHAFPFGCFPSPTPPGRPAAARRARSPFQFHLSPVTGERAG